MSEDADAGQGGGAEAGGGAEVWGTSPLWMLTRHPGLTDLMERLGAVRREVDERPSSRPELRFSRRGLAAVRVEFGAMIREGEERLHRLCGLLCDRYVSPVQLQSVVIGEVQSTRERFTLVQPVSIADLYSITDLDLGTRQLRKLKFFDGTAWSGAALVTNAVEYQPLGPNRFGVQKVLSRIKAEEELWNKVVDEIFGLDALVRRDKQLVHLSRYVKDVFGVKVVVDAAPGVRRFHDELRGLVFTDGELGPAGCAGDPTARSLRFLETKDYTGGADRKASGWEALKSVVGWKGQTFEIQVQSLSNYLREREHLTRESHAGFKSKREALRNDVASTLPLFAFYRDLLRWLFSEGDGIAAGREPPSHPAVRVTVDE